MLFTAPPSPLTLSHHGEVMDARGGVLTLPHMARASPPLPPPPAPIDHPPPPTFTPMPIVSDELDLPGWVPKNYIEKGNHLIYVFTLKIR